MKRYLAMLGMVTLLALPAAVGAEVKPGSEDFFLLCGTTSCADLRNADASQSVESATEEAVITSVVTSEDPIQSTDSSPVMSWDKPYAGDEHSYKGE